jgi:uncharacterized membrane protein YccF (DUF307 family)
MKSFSPKPWFAPQPVLIIGTYNKEGVANLWLIFGGLWACIMHLFFGFLLCITIIGIPWGKQHFKMAGLSLAPFGKDVELGF